MKSLLSILLILLSFCTKPFNAQASTPQSLDDIIDKIDDALENKEAYVEKRQSQIDSLKVLLSRNKSDLGLIREIADSYYNFQIDSALIYYQKGMQAAEAEGDSIAKQRFDLLYVSLLPLAGAVRESVDSYESMSRDKIYAENIDEYIESGSRLYLFTLDYYSSLDKFRGAYGRKTLDLFGEMPQYTEPGTTAHVYYTELSRLLNDGDASIAAANLSDLFDNLTPDDKFYSRIALTLNLYYNSIGNEDKALYYLALAALCDLQSGTREGNALLTLGKILFDRGDQERAYRYLSAALESSVQSGAASRTLQSSRYFPIIEHSMTQRMNKKYVRIMILFVALCVAFVALIISLYTIRKKKKRLQILKEELAEANRVKESYISQFLNLTTVHMEKQEEFNRLIVRKIKASQTDDILKQLSGGKQKTVNMKTFYDIFDNAFLHIYPNFITGVNRLMRPEKKISAGEDQRLNTELRILAFMRLGIDDSTRIARFLGVSINTIYTYRNKLKASAINRETFEKDLLSIDNPV